MGQWLPSRAPALLIREGAGVEHEDHRQTPRRLEAQKLVVGQFDF